MRNDNQTEGFCTRLVCIVLILGTALLYMPVLNFDFVNYDDPLYVINNFHIRTASWQSFVWCFQSGYAQMWHPLTWMSHILDFWLYGLNPGGHHATNVVLHILNSVLLFRVLRRLTRALWRSAMVAALFAWHPLHVESVAWISERKDVLCSLFWLLTVWAYVRYVETVGTPRCGVRSAQRADPTSPNPPGVGPEAKVYYAFAILFFALGLMAKPMLVTLPFVLLLLDWWPLGRVQIGGWVASQADGTKPSSTVIQLIVEKVPFLVLSIIGCVVTVEAASRLTSSFNGMSIIGRACNAVVVYFHFLQKMIWPTDLVVSNPVVFRTGTEVIVAAGFLLAITVVAFRSRKQRKYWAVGWLWYLGMLLPVIGIVQVGAQPMSDHYSYLPSIGIFIIVCWDACDIATGWPRGRMILGGVGVAVLAVFLVMSSRQLQYWRNPVALFEHDLEVEPDDYAAHAAFAAYLRDSFQLDQAQKQCEASIRIRKNYAWPHQVLGGVFYLENKFDQAAAEFHTALRLDPSRPDVHLGLGRVALAQHLPSVAADEFGAMLRTDAASPEARCGLGQALAMQGKLDDAAAQYVEALRLTPQYGEAHFQFAVLLAGRHKTAEAISEYSAAYRLQPDRPELLNNLAWILSTDPDGKNRNGKIAVQLATRACTLTGGQQPVMIGTLAAAYAEAGQFDEAVGAAQQAHDLAVKQRNQTVADENTELLKLYKAHHAYRASQ